MGQDTLPKENTGRDTVDAIVAQWRTERPDVDPSAKEVTGRIIRLASLFQAAYAKEFRPLGLSEGSYGVLVALRRSGSPFELAPGALARQRMMSSGGLTLLVDRLEREGLVQRSPNPDDRRGSLVRLTKAGRKLVDKAMERHAAAEQALVTGLSGKERDELAGALRTLLRSLEDPPPAT